MIDTLGCPNSTFVRLRHVHEAPQFYASFVLHLCICSEENHTMTIHSYISVLFTAVPDSKLYTHMADRAKGKWHYKLSTNINIFKNLELAFNSKKLILNQYFWKYPKSTNLVALMTSSQEPASSLWFGQLCRASISSKLWTHRVWSPVLVAPLFTKLSKPRNIPFKPLIRQRAIKSGSDPACPARSIKERSTASVKPKSDLNFIARKIWHYEITKHFVFHEALVNNNGKLLDNPFWRLTSSARARTYTRNTEHVSDTQSRKRDCCVCYR